MPVAKGRKGVRQVMSEFKHGELHSGSKSGPLVKDRKQAVAIAMSQSGMGKRTAGPLTRRAAMATHTPKRKKKR